MGYLDPCSVSIVWKGPVQRAYLGALRARGTRPFKDIITNDSYASSQATIVERAGAAAESRFTFATSGDTCLCYQEAGAACEIEQKDP